MMFFANLWAKFQLWIIGAGALIIAVFAVLLKAFNAGKSAERAKAQAENLKAMRERKKISDDLQGSSGDDLKRRASRWMSDDKR